MSSYASVADLQAYTSVTLSTDSSGLQQLLDDAERDLDTLFPNGAPTSALWSIQLVGATGGSFTLAVTWLGDVYTTPPIAWNATASDLLAALQSAVDPLGNQLPAGSWSLPPTPNRGAPFPKGPLPGVAAVAAYGQLGGQPITPPAAIPSLTGTGASVLVVQLRGGGTRVDPVALSPADRNALRRAACAQAEYRDQQGEEFFIRAQYQSVSGPEFRTQGRLPYLGPKVKRELQGSTFRVGSARAVAGVRGTAGVPLSPFGTGWPNARGGV